MQLLGWIGLSYTDLIERDWRSCTDLLWTRDVLKYAQHWTRFCVRVWALLYWLPSIIEPIGICCIINPGRDRMAGVKNIPRTTINKIFIIFFLVHSFIHLHLPGRHSTSGLFNTSACAYTHTHSRIGCDLCIKHCGRTDYTGIWLDIKR